VDPLLTQCRGEPDERSVFADPHTVLLAKIPHVVGQHLRDPDGDISRRRTLIVFDLLNSAAGPTLGTLGLPDDGSARGIHTVTNALDDVRAAKSFGDRCDGIPGGRSPSDIPQGRVPAFLPVPIGRLCSAMITKNRRSYRTKRRSTTRLTSASQSGVAGSRKTAAGRPCVLPGIVSRASDQSHGFRVGTPVERSKGPGTAYRA
jgi:hypothetical protein